MGEGFISSLMRKYLALVLILLSIAPLHAQTLRITEFLATNVNGIVDENSTHQGWIEIWNPSVTAKVAMNAMKLTDGTTTWTFPNVEIMPDERMIVFASGKNRINPIAPLHTSFTIAAGGGTLRLLRSDNVVLSEFVNFPAQQPDVSYGRDEWDIAVGPTAVGFYSTPTPEERNNYTGPGVAGKLTFSETSRAFTGSLQVALTEVTPDPAAQIRYTLNGTVPTATSTIYSGPINVTATQQIRARVFRPGLLPGETESNAYLLLDVTTSNFNTAMPLMVVTTFGVSAIGDTLDTNAFLWVWEPALPDNRARFTNPPTLASRIVVDKRGSSTLGNPKFNLNMELRKSRDDDDRNSVLLGMPSHSDWVLGAPFEYDRSDLHNPLAYAMSNAIGRYAPRTKEAEMFIDVTGGALNITTVPSSTTNDYFGVYNVTEKIRRDNDRIDIVNLRKYDNSVSAKTGGYIWKVDRIDAGDTGFSAGGQTMAYYDPKEVEIKSPQRDPQEQYLTGYINSFNSALQGASFRDPVTGYAAWLDVDAAVDHHLLMTWPFNVDALRLSGYWTKQRGAKMMPLPVWDYDRTMSSTDGRDANPAVWQSQVGDLGTDFFNYIWWNRLFLDIDFYQKYIDRWQVIRRGALSRANLDAMIDSLNSEITAEAITREVARWGKTRRSWTSPFTGTNFSGQPAEVQRLKDYMQQRANFMDSQWVGPVTASVTEGNVAVGTQVTLTGPAGATIYYTLNGADPRPNGGAAPGAAATAYTGPIVINETSRLRARAYNPTWTALTGAHNPPLISRWGGLTNVRYSVDARVAAGTLAVTEINFNPVGPSAAELTIKPVLEAKDFEYIELKNISAVPIDLSEAKFTSGINFTFSGLNAITIQPGAYFIVSSNPAAFAARYGSSSLPVVGPWQGDLSNQGERLVIKTLNGTGPTILDFTYDDAWFPNGDGNGGSFEYIGTDYTTSSYNKAENWRDSAQILGSPGTEGVAPAPSIVINEILTNSSTPRVDAIELYNPNPDPVDISGWYLSDVGTATSLDEYKKYRIPNGTIIPASGYLVLTEVNFNPNGAWNPTPGVPGANEFAFNADHGDDAWLVEADAAGKLTRFVSHSDFGASRPDESWGRWPNATGKLYPMVQRTLLDEASATTPYPGLGAPNSVPRFGPLLISEVQHTPSGDNPDLEFIEIYNPTETEQSLAHWQIRGSVDFDFTTETIPAGGRLVVTSFSSSDIAKGDAFRTFYNAPGIVLAGPWSANDKLGLTGEIVLYRAGTPPPLEPNFYPETWEDETNYADGGAWPLASTGMSMGRILAPAGLGDLPESWAPQSTASPGTVGNFVPVAVNDVIHAPLTGGVATLDVRVNDTDLDNNPLTITAVGTPANGTATTDGVVITYTPGAGYNGNDTFTYTISDGAGGTAIGTVQLVNTSPVAVSETLHAPLVGGVATLNVRANDTDAENDPLAIASVGTPANGTATTDGQTITYTPGPNFSGSDQFTYVISDGYGGTATSTVTMENAAPVAVDDVADTAGDPVTIAVLANDSDANSDPLALVSVTDGTSGTTAIEGTSVIYTPGASYLGEDSFTYTISDGFGGMAVGTVTIKASTVLTRTEATTGTAVPGAPGMTFVSLQVPAIGNDGLIAWLSNIKGPGVKSKSVLIGGRPATALLGKGDPVPEFGTSFAFSKLKTPVVDSAGRITFIGTFAGPGVSVKNNTAIFAMQPGGATARIARIGDPAPDAGGRTFAKLTAMDSSDGETAYLATLSGKVSGVWAWDGTTNRRVLNSGTTIDTPVGSKSVSTVSLLNAVPGSPGHPRSHRGGELAMSLGFSDKSKGIALGQLSGETWTTSVLGLTGQATGFGGTWKTFGPAALAEPGVVVLSATLAGSSKVDDTAIVCLGGGDPVLIARESQSSPVSGTTYKSFTDPVANSSGLISFAAKIGGAVASNDDILVLVDALGTSSAVARERDPVPNLPGITWKKFVSFALPAGENSGPIFLAQIAGSGVTKKNNLGLWAHASDGSLVLLARTGQTLKVMGVPKTPTKLTLLNALPPVQGSGRSFNEVQRIAFLATFTDGSQAIQIMRIP